MYTGIIKGLGHITKIESQPGLKRFDIELPSGTESDLEIGASVSVDGVCLTVSALSNKVASFDVMQETLLRTTLDSLSLSDSVNIERSARYGQEIGGHPISGHIDCTAKIIKIERPENNYVITFEVPTDWRRYIFSKGFVALNGASLTITAADKATGTFAVWLIPETLRLTTFGTKQVGDHVNLEVDRNTQVMVDTMLDFFKNAGCDNLKMIQASYLLDAPTASG